jgi:hypothetical protein
MDEEFRWEHPFHQLKQSCEKEAQCNVPEEFPDNQQPLLAGTKEKEKEGSMHDELWNKRVKELVEYRDTNSHCRVPCRYESNRALGSWVSKARTQYAYRLKGKKTALTEARIYELDSLGFVWKSGTRSKEGASRDEVWTKRVQELKAYRDRNGHCRVPCRYESNKALGCWVNRIRNQYMWRGQEKKTPLTDASISELDDLGFVWNANEGFSRDVWKKRVQELIAYRDTNGHCRLPTMYKPNKDLGWWVNRVRNQYTWRGQGKKTPLTDALISELDSLGFVWEATTTTTTKDGLAAADELRNKGVQDISGLSASQVPLNSIDQDAAPPNRTISPPPVPLQGAPRNVLLQSTTAII